ncbi:MAG: hypothetical protein K6B43_00825 [Treponema sp.]|nr:hypothetical protein [Treponema sp.]
MKSKVISTISALFFAGAIGYFALGIFQETKLGEEKTKTKFDTLLLTTKNLAETEKITSSEFKSGFFSAIGDFSDFSEIKLSVDDNCIYSYPSVESKLTNTFAQSKKFISKKTETTAAKNIVRAPADGEDLTYDITISAGIYKIKQNTIYNNAKISFVLAFLGTIISVLALLSKSGKPSDAAIHDAEAKKREEELLAKIREQKQQIDEMQTQQYYEEDDDFDDDFYDEEDDDAENAAETAVAEQPDGAQYYDETVAVNESENAYSEENAEEYAPTEEEATEQAETEQTEIEQVEAEQTESEVAVTETEQNENANSEQIEQPEIEQAEEKQTETEQTEIEQSENPQADTDETENAQSETEQVKATQTENENLQPEIEQQNTEQTEEPEKPEEQAETVQPEPENGVTESDLEETQTDDTESTSEPVLEAPNMKGETTFENIGTDIASPKTFMQDLEEQLKKNTYNEISLALIKITEFDWDSAETEEKAKEIIALSKENFGMQSEVYKSDEPNTLGLVLNGIDLSEAISECERILPAIKEVLDSIGDEHKVHIGISAMNYRAIPPERIMLEAKGALRESELDPENPIVAFKANPDLYKKEIGNELEESES